MRVPSVVKRIGGSIFARLPPTLVKELALRSGDEVMIDVQRRGKTLRELKHLLGKYPDLPKFDRRKMWGDYGERF